MGRPAHHLSRRRPAHHAAGDYRPDARSAGGGTAGLAKARAGIGPRVEQLPDAHQVDCRQSGRSALPHGTAGRLGGRHARWPGGDRSRADSLGRFIGSYSRLAKLPRPRLTAVDLRELVRRVAGLETRLNVTVLEGPPMIIQADGDQIEQVLINLLRNAVDAAQETGGGVTIAWEVSESGPLVLRVLDEGLGLSNTNADLSDELFGDIRWDKNTKWDYVKGLDTARNVPEALKQQLGLS